MKRIIFRKKLFVTKKDKWYAHIYLDLARRDLDLAEKYCKKKDGSYTDQGYKLIAQAAKMCGLAAKKLGFRNVQEMEEYKERHGYV